MTIEEIKRFIVKNKQGLIVGAIVALVVRSILR